MFFFYCCVCPSFIIYSCYYTCSNGTDLPEDKNSSRVEIFLVVLHHSRMNGAHHLTWEDGQTEAVSKTNYISEKLYSIKIIYKCTGR